MTERTRVLVVGGDRPFEGAAKRLFDDDPGLDARGVSDLAAAQERCAADPPDVVLLDLDLPDVDGTEATRALRLLAPAVKVLVTARMQSPERIALVLASGACGFVPSTTPPEDVAAIVRRAAGGEIVLPVGDLQEVVGQLDARRAVRAEAREGLERLTVREREVLGALARGNSTVEVAEEYGISRLTVQSHVKSILAKLGVHSKVEAVTLAWRHGLAPTSRSA